MRVQILGPVAVVVDGRPVVLGSPKERALFAVLVANDGHVVSLDRLADELWGGDPPDQSVAALRVYVSHLRKVLPEGVVVTREPGYVLEIDDEQLDARQFERLARSGRAQLEAGDPSSAAATLTEALAQWHGTPFEDVAPTPAITAEVMRLDTLRLDALEDHFEAALQLGRHRDVLPDLSTLVGEHPLRERLWGQLILALYRCGRQADALRAYQQARTTLIDQLGIEPGPALRELESAVLAQDPKLGAPKTARTVRHNLPAARTTFVGRERELAHVLKLLQQPERLVTLTGIGGCGKTRLAIEAARSVIDEYADGVFLVELAGLSDAGLVAATVAATIGIDVSNLDSTVVDRLCEYLATRRVLLVIDNCEHVINGCAELLDGVLTRCDSVRVLATSRESIDIDGERSWRVPSLTISDEGGGASDAVALFVERAQVADASFALTAANNELVVQICRRLDGIPLALELAAARLRMMSVDDVARRLDDRFKLLTGRRSAVPRQQTLEATMDWSYELLDEDDRISLRRLGVFVGTFSMEAAQAVAGATVDALGRLVDKSLVSVTIDSDKTRYGLLETVRQYALAKLLAAGESETIFRRHCDWYVEIGRGLGYFTTTKRWAAILASEYENFRAALDWSFQDDDPESVGHLVAMLSLHWFYAGRLVEGLTWAERAGKLESMSMGLRARVGARLGFLRWASGQGEAAVAAINACATLAEECGDPHAMAEVEILSGALKMPMGLLDEACVHFARAHELVTEDDEQEYAYALMGVGFGALFRGDLTEAITLFDEAIARAKRGDNLVVLNVTSTYGTLLAALTGDVDGCRERFREWRASQDWTAPTARFAALGQHLPMGTAALLIGDSAIAEELACECLVMLRDIGATMNVADALALLVVTTSVRTDHADTARLLGATSALGEKHGANIALLALIKDIDRAREAACAALGPVRYEQEFANGARMTANEAIDFGLQLTMAAGPATA